MTTCRRGEVRSKSRQLDDLQRQTHRLECVLFCCSVVVSPLDGSY